MQAEAFVGSASGQSACETQLNAPSLQLQVVSAIPPCPLTGPPSASYLQARFSSRMHALAAAGTMDGQGVSQLQPSFSEQRQTKGAKVHCMPSRVHASASAGALAGQSALE
jgi:hypothetical protein